MDKSLIMNEKAVQYYQQSGRHKKPSSTLLHPYPKREYQSVDANV